MENTVLVTGFGPFHDHKTNASWQSVKLLPKYSNEGLKIVVEEIPVDYECVDNTVPMLWNEHNPKVYCERLYAGNILEFVVFSVSSSCRGIIGGDGHNHRDASTQIGIHANRLQREIETDGRQLPERQRRVFTNRNRCRQIVPTPVRRIEVEIL